MIDPSWFRCEEIIKSLSLDVDCCRSCHEDDYYGMSEMCQFDDGSGRIAEVCCSLLRELNRRGLEDDDKEILDRLEAARKKP